MRSSSDTTATDTGPSFRQRLLRETAVIGGLVLAGLVALPILVYVIGEAVFGEYGGTGFAGFYVRLHREFLGGEPGAIFLLLSPVILWLALRLTLRLFRRLGKRPA